jgi:hypothetical protein
MKRVKSLILDKSAAIAALALQRRALFFLSVYDGSSSYR